MPPAGNNSSASEDERAFSLISGNRVLDLLATLRTRHQEPVECLRAPVDLDRWLRVAGLTVEIKASASDLDDARRLRETVNRLTRGSLAGLRPDTRDLHELNQWAREPPLAPQLDAKLQPQWTAQRPVQAALAVLAREAVELLTGPERAFIRECEAAPYCSRLYLDRSPAHRRRWCKMEWCGSRAKMASYRRRQREQGAPDVNS